MSTYLREQIFNFSPEFELRLKHRGIVNQNLHIPNHFYLCLTYDFNVPIQPIQHMESDCLQVNATSYIDIDRWSRPTPAHNYS